MKAWMMRCSAALGLVLALAAVPGPALAGGSGGGCATGTAGIMWGEPIFTACDVKGGEHVVAVKMQVSTPGSQGIQAAHDIYFVYDLFDGTAKAGEDYEPVVGGVGMIPAGASAGYVPVNIYPDNLVENEEFLILKVRYVIGATVADGEAVITIEANQT